MSARARLLALALSLCAANLHAQDDENIPELGERTKDGFLVRCYWVGKFDGAQRERGQGVVGVFGQALSPLNYDQHTTATLILSEQADKDGKLRLKVHVARWESKVTNCHYWSKAGQHVPAGAGGSGSGNIAEKDLSLTTSEANGSISIDFGINTSGDEYKFDVSYVPLEIKGLSVQLAKEAKTKQFDPNIIGVFRSDEPVKPNKKTVIRQELNDPRGSYYYRWIVTRVCDTAGLHLVSPKGTSTRYTFNSVEPGALDVHFLAVTKPENAGLMQRLRDRVSFDIDNIGASQKQWDGRSPGGRARIEGKFFAADLKFAGLPASNADFGPKEVRLLVDGKTIDTARVKVFFPKLATNHAGGVKGDPNWFYYWKEGQVCGIGPNDTYDATKKANVLGYSTPSADDFVRLCRAACFANQGPVTYTGAAPWGSQIVCGHGKGIKCVAEIVEHERHHVAIYKAFHDQIAKDKTTDKDGDGVPSAAEAQTDGIKSNSADPDTFNIAASIPDYAKYGDDEVRCRKTELKLSNPYYPEKDWADPGCQSKVPYGP